MVDGLVKSHDPYFDNFFKYLKRCVLQFYYIDKNYHFLTYHFSKYLASIRGSWVLGIVEMSFFFLFFFFFLYYFFSSSSFFFFFFLLVQVDKTHYFASYI